MALTATEFRLLEDLLRHAGAVRTREQLLNNVWGYSFEGYARTVDTHVRRLRSKLGQRRGHAGNGARRGLPDQGVGREK